MLKRFSKYVLQSVAGMIGLSVYILADTFFIAYSSGADGLAALNLILPVFGLIYAIGAMIGIGSATRYGISKAKGEAADHYFPQSIAWSVLFSIPSVSYTHLDVYKRQHSYSNECDHRFFGTSGETYR